MSVGSVDHREDIKTFLGGFQDYIHGKLELNRDEISQEISLEIERTRKKLTEIVQRKFQMTSDEIFQKVKFAEEKISGKHVTIDSAQNSYYSDQVSQYESNFVGAQHLPKTSGRERSNSETTFSSMCISSIGNYESKSSMDYDHNDTQHNIDHGNTDADNMNHNMNMDSPPRGMDSTPSNSSDRIINRKRSYSTGSPYDDVNRSNIVEQNRIRIPIIPPKTSTLRDTTNTPRKKQRVGTSKDSSEWKEGTRQLWNMIFKPKCTELKKYRAEILNEAEKTNSGEYKLTLSNKSDLHNLLIYLPCEELEKLPTYWKSVGDICKKMDKNLEEKKKKWKDMPLFIDFTHLLVQYKWFDKKFPEERLELMQKYDKLCNKWFERYGNDVITTWKHELNTLSKIKSVGGNCQLQLEVMLQFSILLKRPLDDQTHSHISAFLENFKHTNRTETICLLREMNLKISE